MSEISDRLNPLRIRFDEIYRRHLCRHGHFGINILHLIAVIGIYLSLFGIVGRLVNEVLPDVGRSPVVVLMFTVPWFLVVCRNVPWKVSISTGVFVTVLACLWSRLPVPPVWVWFAIIVGMHRFQLWSHSLYPMHRDMTEFSETYPKGFRLFVLLLVYELPILLKYLILGREDWIFGKTMPSHVTAGNEPLNRPIKAPFDAAVPSDEEAKEIPASHPRSDRHRGEDAPLFC